MISSGQGETCTEFVYERSVLLAALSTEQDLVGLRPGKSPEYTRHSSHLGNADWAGAHARRRRGPRLRPGLLRERIRDQLPDLRGSALRSSEIPILWMTNLTLNLDLFSLRHRQVLLWTRCLMLNVVSVQPPDQ